MAPLIRGALLEYRGPDDAGRLHALRVGRNLIGRDEGCDVRLEDGKVSGSHGFLFLRPLDATFVDTSTNGSKVDGKALLGEQVVVSHGAVLELGGTRLVLLFVDESVTAKLGIK